MYGFLSHVSCRYLLTPMIVAGTKITTETYLGYRSHGLLGAADKGLDALAEIVPGGQTIMNSLREQEAAVEKYTRNTAS